MEWGCTVDNMRKSPVHVFNVFALTRRRVLGIHLSSGVQDAVGIKWDLCLCLLLAWIVVYFCIWKGIRTSGKVSHKDLIG